MSFKDLQLKHSYCSENDDILTDFYIPILSESTQYSRITGYFSSTSFGVCAEGLAKFISNGGHMRFITNIQLSEQDYDQIDKGTKRPEDIVADILIEDIDQIEETLKNDYISMLGWLIANNYLELKIGYIKNPKTNNDILHQKVGILRDKEGNVVTFSGSNNETAFGWSFHSEKFKVFCDWEEGVKDYIEQDLDDFETLWRNESKRTSVISFPEAVKKRIIKKASRSESAFKESLERLTNSRPKSSSVNLREYQKEAIAQWESNNYKGIFEMATGTGKTFTAIEAIKKILKKENEIIVVISLPFLHLTQQWLNSLEKAGVELPSIVASSSNSKWKKQIKGASLDIKLKRLKQLIILTTHDTSSSEKFIEEIRNFDCSLMLVGDEVHGMGSANRMEGLVDKYEYRLGLSATPDRYFDEEGTTQLFNFFDKTVFEFDLHQAINQINPETGETYLTPYEYHPIFIELDIYEMDKYIKISREIARLYSKKTKTKQDNQKIEHKLRLRSDIIKNTKNKLPHLRELITRLKSEKQLKRTLVYCSPQQIEPIQQMMKNVGKIVQHKFTSDEDATKKQTKYGNMTERDYLLKNFDEGVYDVLVAIKCLDEGVDVPSTKTAILMSSTGNPKEYIQRRGRVLRRYPGKEKAIIYDFIVIPDIGLQGEGFEYEGRIIESQFKRINEFVNESINMSETSRYLFKIKLKYKILGSG